MNSNKYKTLESRRYYFVLLLFIIIGIVWVSQLFLIQIVDVYNFPEERYKRSTPKKKFIIPTRGKIFDRNHELLVTTSKFYQIEIHKATIKKNIKPEENVQDYLNNIAELCTKVSSKSKRYFLEKLAKPNPLLFFKLGENDKDELERLIKENKIPGLVISLADYKRSYMNNETALRLLGSVRVANDTILNTLPQKSKYTLEGQNGIEFAFNSQLNGAFGWEELLNDARGNPVPKKGLQEKLVSDGQNIHLTIDFNLQHEIETILQSTLIKYKAQAALCTVMDPNNGEIIAMAGVDANELDHSSNVVRGYGNLPATYLFEPGSTFKPFTMLGAIDEQVYNTEKRIDCSKYVPDYTGLRSWEKREITDDHEVDHPLNAEEIIAYSSNVGISKVAEKLGEIKFYKLLRKLGFGQKVPTEISRSTNGIISSYVNWTQFSLHSISFGQEISVTQLQLANAYCAIANGGYLLKPHIVKEISDNHGNVLYEAKREKLRRIAGVKSVRQVKSFLEKVFEYGTAHNFKSKYMKLAGKTGTAQTKNKKTRYSNKWDYTATFAGYLPADNPKYVIVVTYDKPSWYYRYAAQSALPTFEKVYERILSSKGSYVTEEFISRTKEFITMPSLIGMTYVDAKRKLNSLNIKFTSKKYEDTDIITKQFPFAGSVIPRNERKITISSNQVIDILSEEMPNFKGKTIREVVEFCTVKNIAFDFRGTGLVSKQNIKPKTKLNTAKKLVLWCK